MDQDSYCYDYIDKLNYVDAVVLITPWDHYLKLPNLMKNSEAIILDTRGFFKPSDFKENKYLKVGLK